MMAQVALRFQGQGCETGSVRIVQLYVGLVLFGVTVAMVILSDLGNAPWDVLHQGLEEQTGLGTGWWAIVVGALVMVAWIPLRERPGLGTVSNVIVVGLVMQVVLDRYAPAGDLPGQLALLIGGVAGNGVACAMYIGARFGPGPRDGLMTGIARISGRPIGAVRAGLEITVLAGGIVLGGTFGPGTVLYALAIGPIVQVMLPRLDRRGARPPRACPSGLRGGAAGSARA